jgi:1-acyl-sn-glycerol-3-phosphate acyltransferase
MSDLLTDKVMTGLKPVTRYFTTHLHGAERLPIKRKAFLVGNHSLMGIDSVVLFPELFDKLERLPHGLAHRALFEIPAIRPFLNRIGLVEGSRERAISLLNSDQLVVAYPGGVKDSTKGQQNRYELQWEGRQGFAHVAIQAQASVYPVAAIGPDEAFVLEGAESNISIPFFSNDDSQCPFFVPVPRRVPFHFYIGPPLEPPDLPDDASTERRNAVAESFADEVKSKLQAMLSEYRPAPREFDSAASRLLDFVTRGMTWTP